MSDDLTFENDLEDQEPQENRNIRHLREKAKRTDDAEAKASVLERRIAFMEAGISATDPKASYFVKGYEGELTAEAIRAAAEEAGFLKAPESDTPPPATDAYRRIDAATEGAPPPGPPDGEAQMRALYERGMNEHWSSERFALELTHLAKDLGLPTAYDGSPILPERVFGG